MYMAKVTIEDGRITCEGENGNVAPCNVLGLFSINQQCGNCPLIEFGDKYVDVKFDIGC